MGCKVSIEKLSCATQELVGGLTWADCAQAVDSEIDLVCDGRWWPVDVFVGLWNHINMGGTRLCVPCLLKCDREAGAVGTPSEPHLALVGIYPSRSLQCRSGTLIPFLNRSVTE